MGDDTIYSGTVAAAMEGYLFGLRSIAFSQVDKGWGQLDAAAVTARQIVEQALTEGGAGPWLLNVNIPNRPLDQLASVKVCRLGRRHSAERVITQQNPRGETSAGVFRMIGLYPQEPSTINKRSSSHESDAYGS